MPEPTPTATETEGLVGSWTECTNERLGYTVSYPEGWQTNALGPRTQCRWFDPEAFQLEEGQDAPLVALTVRPTIGTYQDALAHLRDPYGERSASFEKLRIGGRRAVKFEKVQTRDIQYPEGTRTYGYVLNHRGTAFYVQTKSVPGVATRYARRKKVVDEVARKLEFSAG